MINDGELEKHISGTYFGLRRGMTLIGFGLPVALIVGGLSAGPDDGFTCSRLCGSISAYYAAGAPLLRDMFVGALIATAALLISYKGFSEAEDSFLNVAGGLAVIVALVPAPHLAHQLAAVGVFLCMALVCWFRAGDTLPLVRDEKVRRTFAVQYKTQGVMMVAFPAAAVGLALAYDHSILVLAVETAAMWVFGWYWMTKSREMRRTQADRRAVVKSRRLPESYEDTGHAPGAGAARGGEGLGAAEERGRLLRDSGVLRLPGWARLLLSIFASEYIPAGNVFRSPEEERVRRRRSVPAPTARELPNSDEVDAEHPIKRLA